MESPSPINANSDLPFEGKEAEKPQTTEKAEAKALRFDGEVVALRLINAVGFGMSMNAIGNVAGFRHRNQAYATV